MGEEMIRSTRLIYTIIIVLFMLMIVSTSCSAGGRMVRTVKCEGESIKEIRIASIDGSTFRIIHLSGEVEYRSVRDCVYKEKYVRNK